MKFSCDKNLLVSGISIASRTVAQKSSIPALEGIYVRAGMELYLSGYNLETGITVTVSADIAETGTCVMPARLFFDIIRKLPDDEVTISVDSQFKVFIKSGIASFTISAMSAEDYPELPDVEYENAIKIPQNKLREMISGTIFSVSENMARPVQTGCLIEVEPNNVTMVAVDGFRLALRRFYPEESLDRDVKFVVPSAALEGARKDPRRDRRPRCLHPGQKAHPLRGWRGNPGLPHPRGRIFGLAPGGAGEQPHPDRRQPGAAHGVHRPGEPHRHREGEKPRPV